MIDKAPVVGILPGHRGYTPTLYEKCHGIFIDHRVSGPRFNISSERRGGAIGILSRASNWLETALHHEILKVAYSFFIKVSYS